MGSRSEVSEMTRAVAPPVAPIGVHMTGSEWFSSNPGGLGRYFSDLFGALRLVPEVDVSAAAFGTPDPGGSSWGPTVGSTMARVARSTFDNLLAPTDVVVDRHFSLFGRPSFGPRGTNPLVVHFHGPWAAESAVAGSSSRAVLAKKMLERARYSGADKFVVLSRHSRTLLVQDYRIPEESIDIIPPGVDLKKFTPSNRVPDRPTVVCVRRLETRMGIDVLVRAWPTVVAAHPDALLVIVGEGSQESALKAQVESAGITKSVRFEGKATDERLVELYSESSLSVVPTVALEGFGLIALESLAAGRPPIVTDCGGLPDAVAGLDPSLIVPAGDAQALADRLRSALNGDIPDSAACRTYAEKFTWQVAAERHVGLYRSVTR